MPADVDDLLQRAAVRPIHDLDLTALDGRRRRRRVRRRTAGVLASVVVLAVAMLMISELPVRRVDLAPADRGTASTIGPDRLLLASGDDWELVATARPDLVLRLRRGLEGPPEVGDGESVREYPGQEVGDYTHPDTLNEAHPFPVPDADATLIAGPVTRQATRVVVTAGGAEHDATLGDVGRDRVFVVRVPGRVGVDAIVAFDDTGAVVDRSTLPPMPPGPDAPAPVPPPPPPPK